MPTLSMSELGPIFPGVAIAHVVAANKIPHFRPRKRAWSTFPMISGNSCFDQIALANPDKRRNTNDNYIFGCLEDLLGCDKRADSSSRKETNHCQRR